MLIFNSNIIVEKDFCSSLQNNLKETKMKKINILILLVALVFASCDNYLDIVPKGQVLLTNVEEYNGLFNDDDFLHQDYWAAAPIGTTDEYWVMYDKHITDNPNSVKTANFLWDESIDRVSLTLQDLFYNRAYERISRYNIIMQEVLDSEGSEADKKEAYAKAKVLRAFNHFLLVNYYAKHYNASTAATDNGIVVVKTFDMEQSSVQTSVQDAYDFIVQDITEAIGDLKDIPANTFHPSKAFGYALLAKVNLFMGNYDGALENANKSLEINNYVNDLVDAHYNSTPGYYTPDMPGSYNSPDYLYYGGGAWGQPSSAYISETAINWFNPDATGMSGDIRLDNFWSAPSWIPGATFRLYRQYGDYKHIGTGINVSEAFLIKAECLARNGDTNGAMKIINELRVLRILPENYVPLTAANAKAAVNIVIEERSREMVNSLNRFWDIRRLANEADYAIELSKVFDGKTYTTTGNSHIFIMPFPRNVTDRNASIKQNTK